MHEAICASEIVWCSEKCNETKNTGAFAKKTKKREKCDFILRAFSCVDLVMASLIRQATLPG
jgi:hypothetical protein